MPAEKPKTREKPSWTIAYWHLSLPEYRHFCDPCYKTMMMATVASQWKIEGIILHHNQGSESFSIGIAENRVGLLKRGCKVMTYERSMGDERELEI